MLIKAYEIYGICKNVQTQVVFEERAAENFPTLTGIFANPKQNEYK